MSFQRLTLRTKHSLSGLYSFSDPQSSSLKETIKTSDTNKENDPVDLEEFGSYTSSLCTDIHKPSPSKDSPSRRRRLMGSLRRIGSLRNMHSPPSKTKDLKNALAEPELTGFAITPLQSCSPTAQSPYTPVRGTRQPLALDFEESPPGRPMFEILSRNRSDSLDVQCSSPVPIPSISSVQPAHPCDLPAGTIPISPGPMQKAFELDSTNLSPSPSSSPVLHNPLLTPMPGTNLTFEDIQLADERSSSDPRLSHESSGYFPPVNMGTVLGHGEARKTPAVVNKHHRGQDTLAGNPIHPDDRAEEGAGPVTQCAEDISAPSERESRANDSEHVEPPMDVTHVVWEEPTTRSLISIDLGPRQSTWGDHNGLYDGTGYGDESRGSAFHSSTSSIEGGDQQVPAPVKAADQHVDQNTNVVVPSTQVEGVSLEPAHSQPGYETLEEVIRSYAAFERGSGAVSPDEELTEDHSDASIDHEELK